MPILSSTNAGKSIVGHITPICTQTTSKEEDTRDAALLLTNVGMLMAKEVNDSFFQKSVPDLSKSSEGSFCGPNSTINSSSTLGVLNPSTSFPIKWNAHNIEERSHHSCTISQKDDEKVVKLSRRKLKETLKEYGNTISLGLNSANLNSHSIRSRAVSMDQSSNMQHHRESDEQLIHIIQPMSLPILTAPIVTPPTSPIARSISQDHGAGFGIMSMPLPLPMAPLIPMQFDTTVAKNTSARHVDRRKRYLDSSPSFKDGKSCRNTSNTGEEIHESGRKKQDDRFVQDIGTPKPINCDKHKNNQSCIHLKLILRKKFSWKNYPILEAFLVANRAEYLRHSALNYTMQQKNYNNRLTERLLELAEENGYVFDREVFSFVTVRDRIRCYFKSYVQSRKKRGVIIGYAARRAGLLSEKEIEASASRKGTIVVP